MAKSPISITFLLNGQDVRVSHPEETILEAALANKLEIDHSCGGYGTCGTCLVHVSHGLENFAERNEVEAEMAQDRGFDASERLACQNKALAGLVLTVGYKKDLNKSK